ncbi:hypothetical protein F4808DRAFT_439713 [Astrocystis sublimbata]|nr:hypothetical protein F4808DRAFT_439713 [Astrocystis sublimbata]
MFQTLKARRSTNGESAYVVQSAGMPFEKNKGKKQRACTLCKLKKLKCVLAEGESPETCVKCLKQGLECSYKNGPVSTSKSNKKGSKSESKASSASEKSADVPKPSTDGNSSITVRETAASSPSSTPSTTTTVQTDPTLSENFSFADLLDSEIPFDFWTLSNDSGMDMGDAPIYLAANDGGENTCDVTGFPRIHSSKATHDFPLGYSHVGGGGLVDGPAISGGSSLDTTPMTASPPSTEPLSWEPNLIPEMHMPSLGDSSGTEPLDAVGFSTVPASGPPLETISLQSPSAACHCLEKLMGANEDMQVKLVWGAYPPNGGSVSVDDMLQCQKDILVSCETLLECDRCSLRSDYVMLVVSMCHEMMNGIADLSAMLLPGSQNGSVKRARSESDGGRKRGLKAGGWRLDDEDEIQVIKSLIGIRITRLGSLTTLLEKVVNAHRPAYEWVIRALRQSITERIATIGSEQDGLEFTSNL